MTTLGDIGERQLIRELVTGIGAAHDVIQGPGDDCAVVRSPGDDGIDLLLTSDPVIEGVHFSSQTPPDKVGHKAMARALSDIAAMGGAPSWVLIDLVAPASTSLTQITEIYRGARQVAARHHASIVGGDTAQGPVIELHIFAVGRVPKGTAVLRSGAKAGDRLFVTGSLGGSLTGKHCCFEPRVREGCWIRDWATSMIDLSDGLGTDLEHIARMSGVGARIAADRIPLAEPVLAARDGRSALEHALTDGEDFELLFTVPRERSKAFAEEWTKTHDLACTELGEMTEQADSLILLLADGSEARIQGGGYEHFSTTGVHIKRT